MRNGKRIAQARGGRRVKNGWIFRCPCHDDRTPSCAIRDDGLITCFGGCPRDKVAIALDALGFTDDGQPHIKRLWTPDAPPDPQIMDAWIYAQPIENTEAEKYLRSRGIGAISAELRYRPDAFHPRTKALVPAMIAAVRGNERVVGVQVTYLVPIAKEEKRRTAGTLGGGAVKLAAPFGNELGLAEGVETALSATQIFGIPCWATLGSKRLDAVELPYSIGRLHIFADNDDAGREAVQRAIARYCHREYRHVTIHWPDDEYNDWNDFVMGKKQDAKRLAR